MDDNAFEVVRTDMRKIKCECCGHSNYRTVICDSLWLTETDQTSTYIEDWTGREIEVPDYRDEEGRRFTKRLPVGYSESTRWFSIEVPGLWYRPYKNWLREGEKVAAVRDRQEQQ